MSQQLSEQYDLQPDPIKYTLMSRVEAVEAEVKKMSPHELPAFRPQFANGGSDFVGPDCAR